MSSAIKLDFSTVEPCGRREELETLTNAFEESLREESSSSSRRRGKLGVLIQGAAGTGKTTLLAEFQKSVAGRCFFCRGKFDKEESSAEGPYAAVIGCLTELVDCLIEDDAVLWRTRIKERINAESYLLSRLVVRLRDLVDVEKESGGGKKCDHDDDVTGGHVLDRIGVAVEAFLMFVCSIHPVVFVAEDLHWCSEECKRLMRVGSGTTDSGCRQYLFVGTYRELDGGLLEAVKTRMTIREIHLSGLSMDHVGSMVRNLLRRDEEDVVRPLAEAVHRKTGGNPFFCVQFLQTLEARKLIYYSLNSCRWEWSVDRILGETDISDNVVDVVIGRIKTLPEDAQLALTRAASLGPSRFDLDTLMYALRAEEEESPGGLLEEKHNETPEEEKKEETKDRRFVARCPKKLEELLETIVAEGLVEKLPVPKNYKFSHDRIHEGAYALLPEGDGKKRLHLTIGMSMRRRLAFVPEDEKGTTVEARLLLLAVHHLDLGHELLVDADDNTAAARVHLAALNLEAADLALKRVSFAPAMEYLGLASSLLGHSWEDNYDLMLKLNTKLAETYLCTGQYIECGTTVEAVLNNAVSFEDKLASYRLLIRSLCSRARFEEAFTVNFYVLKELGIRFGSHLPAGFHVVQACVRLNRALRGKTEEDLLALPECTNERVISQSTFLAELTHLCALSHRQREYGVIGNLHVLLLTLKHGLLRDTGQAFAMYGITRIEFGHYDDARRYGGIGLQIARGGKSGYQYGLCLLMNHYVIHHWRNPFHDSLEPVLRAYQLFAQSTEVDFSYMDFAMTVYAKLYLCCGLRLNPLEVDLRKFTEEMGRIGQGTHFASYKPWWQLVLNLTGKAENPMILHGEAVTAKQYKTLIENECMSAQLDVCRVILAFTLGDTASLAEIFGKKRTNRAAATTPDVIRPQILLIEGLYASSMARSTGKGEFRRRANKIVARFNKWVKAGSVNCHHMLKLLLAEQLHREGADLETVRAAYDDAIASAAKLGFLHNHALANERASVFFLERDDDDDDDRSSWAKTYMTRCRELYADLGATAKVARLESRYGWCFGGSSVEKSSFGVGLKGRSRLDELAKERERRYSRLSFLSSGKLSGP